MLVIKNTLSNTPRTYKLNCTIFEERLLLRGQSKEQVPREILVRLGEKDTEGQFAAGRQQRPARELRIYIMSRVGAYTHKEIGEVFSVRVYSHYRKHKTRGGVFAE